MVFFKDSLGKVQGTKVVELPKQGGRLETYIDGRDFIILPKYVPADRIKLIRYLATDSLFNPQKKQRETSIKLLSMTSLTPSMRIRGIHMLDYLIFTDIEKNLPNGSIWFHGYLGEINEEFKAPHERTHFLAIPPAKELFYQSNP